jgi:hypothetical protein
VSRSSLIPGRDLAQAAALLRAVASRATGAAVFARPGSSAQVSQLQKGPDASECWWHQLVAKGASEAGLRRRRASLNSPTARVGSAPCGPASLESGWRLAIRHGLGRGASLHVIGGEDGLRWRHARFNSSAARVGWAPWRLDVRGERQAA